MIRLKEIYMKRNLLMLFLFVVCSCFVTYSQFEYYKPEITIEQHQKGDVIFSVSPNILCNTPKGVQLAGGLKFQKFLSERFSLDADLVFGRDYVHAGPGIIGIPMAIIAFGSASNWFETSTSLSDFLFYTAAIALSFEHISYHIPVTNGLEVTPYVSILRYKYAYRSGNHSNPDVKDEQLSFAAGVEINKYVGRFVFSPYAEYNIGYEDHIHGYNIGIYCGIYFPVKK
jgi:hypothetical protein